MRQTDVMAKKLPSLPFEVALAELEPLVGQLEQGEPIPLNEMLQRFAQGVVLVRSGRTAQRQADQKVGQLLEQNGESAISLFSAAVG